MEKRQQGGRHGAACTPTHHAYGLTAGQQAIVTPTGQDVDAQCLGNIVGVQAYFAAMTHEGDHTRTARGDRVDQGPGGDDAGRVVGRDHDDHVTSRPCQSGDGGQVARSVNDHQAATADRSIKNRREGLDGERRRITCCHRQERDVGDARNRSTQRSRGQAAADGREVGPPKSRRPGAIHTGLEATAQLIDVDDHDVVSGRAREEQAVGGGTRSAATGNDGHHRSRSQGRIGDLA